MPVRGALTGGWNAMLLQGDEGEGSLPFLFNLRCAAFATWPRSFAGHFLLGELAFLPRDPGSLLGDLQGGGEPCGGAGGVGALAQQVAGGKRHHDGAQPRPPTQHLVGGALDLTVRPGRYLTRGAPRGVCGRHRSGLRGPWQWPQVCNPHPNLFSPIPHPRHISFRFI